MYQYCTDRYLAHYDAFTLGIREIDAQRLAEIQKAWCLFLGPPEIGRAVDRAVLELQERRSDIEVWQFFTHGASLWSRAISAPINLLAIRAGSPGAQMLSEDSRLAALNPILDQMCQKQTINIQSFLKEWSVIHRKPLP